MFRILKVCPARVISLGGEKPEIAQICNSVQINLWYDYSVLKLDHPSSTWSTPDLQPDASNKNSQTGNGV